MRDIVATVSLRRYCVRVAQNKRMGLDVPEFGSIGRSNNTGRQSGETNE
jgi:hypothetical protein